jgi:hypothetical protein
MAKQEEKKMIKIERPKMVEFESVGDTAIGTLVGITTGETRFGEAQFLKITTDEGEKLSVCVSASLSLVDWEDLLGKYISITYTGEEKSTKNKGKTYKTFDVAYRED